VKKLVYLPVNSKEAIYDEFDPVMIVREIFDKRVPPYIALSLDFEGTDAEFV